MKYDLFKLYICKLSVLLVKGGPKFYDWFLNFQWFSMKLIYNFFIFQGDYLEEFVILCRRQESTDQLLGGLILDDRRDSTQGRRTKPSHPCLLHSILYVAWAPINIKNSNNVTYTYSFFLFWNKNYDVLDWCITIGNHVTSYSQSWHSH